MKREVTKLALHLRCGLSATCAIAFCGGLLAFANAVPAADVIKLTSPSFQPGKPIPVAFTCEGENASPKLQWSGVPAGTKSLALICEDPDAPSGTWTHWVLYNLPAATVELAEKTPAAETLPNGARQGVNNFKRVGYSGSCPPPGKPHRYVFKLYALDTALTLKSRATRQELLRAMEGHVVAQGQLTGTYARKE